MDNFLFLLIFINVLVLIELGYFALRTFRSSEKREVQRRLKLLSFPKDTGDSVNILRKNVLSEIPWLNRFLKKLALMEKMTHLVEQAGAQSTPGLYFLSSLTLAVVGFLAGSQIHLAYFPLLRGVVIIIPVIGIMAILPVLYLRRRRKKRFQKFETQLPEALDLIARSLRAGHAFSSGLKLASEEMREPASVEFGKTLNEINFGISVPDALVNFANRIPIDDLRFFVISLLLQRETGGNLAEILENLSHLIRERFKLYGRVRVLSAQARISAYVLVAMPFVISLLIHLIHPKFYEPFFENPASRYLIGFGVAWMILGIFAMKKMIAIRV